MTIRFKSPIVVEPNKFTWYDVEFPDPGPNEVIFRIRACLICGSDLHVYKGLHPMAPIPCCCGHEIAADVVEVGRNVTRLKLGDRVYVAGIGGRARFKVDGKEVGRFPSGFGEYTIGYETDAYKIPDNVSYYEAAVTTDLAYVTDVLRRSGGGVGDSAVILGAGPIGLRTLEVAKLSGIWPVIVSEILDYRLDKAMELGADYVVNPLEKDPVKRVLEITGGIGVDKVYDTTGNPKATGQGIAMLNTKRGGDGAIYLMGLFEHPNDSISVNASDIMRKASRIVAEWGMGIGPEIVQDSLDMMAQGRVHVSKWLTHRFPESKADEAMRMLIEKRENAIGVEIVR